MSEHLALWNQVEKTDPRFTKEFNRVCSVKGCSDKHEAKGYCNKHYQRMRLNNSLDLKTRERGTGTIDSGYHSIEIGGNKKKMHRIIVENITGIKLDNKACIHHVDGNGLNNKNSNLVVCPDQKYHSLLHIRQKALNESGDPNLRKCPYCKRYDETKNMKLMNKNSYYHADCANRKSKLSRISKQEVS